MSRRSVPERIVAWLVTGPIGHLLAGVADWLTLLARLQLRRFKRRDPSA